MRFIRCFNKSPRGHRALAVTGDHGAWMAKTVVLWFLKDKHYEVWYRYDEKIVIFLSALCFVSEA